VPATAVVVANAGVGVVSAIALFGAITSTVAARFAHDVVEIEAKVGIAHLFDRAD
jgi:hypothetical protein